MEGRELMKFFICVALLVGLNVGWVRGFEYSNRELGFKVRLPDGFEGVSSRTRTEGVVMMKAKFNRDNSLSRLLSIQDLGEVIRQDANFSRLRKSAGNVKLEKIQWRAFEVDVFSVTELDRGMAYVSLNAQIPLKPRAIQVSLSAPKSEERVLHHELETLLATIEGPSNWVTSRDRSALASAGVVRTSVVIAALLVLVSGALWYIFRRQGSRK